MDLDDLGMLSDKKNPNLLKSSQMFKTQSSNFNSKKEETGNQNFTSNNQDGELSFKNEVDEENPNLGASELKGSELKTSQLKPVSSFKQENKYEMIMKKLNE